MADDIDFELSAQIIKREKFKRPPDTDAGVINQSGKSLVTT
jgi:hypothetical protein